jgi:hypothetical protein
MSKHTPGPWLKDAGSIYAECQLDDQGMTRQRPLAEVTSDEDNDPNYHGNCAMIAAAPDLLEALQYARRFMRKDLHDTDYIDGVIAKATGETNEP